MFHETNGNLLFTSRDLPLTEFKVVLTRLFVFAGYLRVSWYRVPFCVFVKIFWLLMVNNINIFSGDSAPKMSQQAGALTTSPEDPWGDFASADNSAKESGKWVQF